METAAAAPTVRARLVYLPNTCPENRRHHTHLRLLSRVDPGAPGAVAFHGRLLWPGVRLAASELGERPVVLECAGPQGHWKNGRHRDVLWILWRYDWPLREWIEIARARSLDASWAQVLREPAIHALAAPVPEQSDLVSRGRDVAGELLAAIDERLGPERAEVRNVVLTTIYDQMAGRIARL